MISNDLFYKRDPLFVSATVIRQIFSTMLNKQKIPVQVVIFNSCYSSTQAEAISDLVPYIVGTSWGVTEQAAHAFAYGFYSFLLETGDIERPGGEAAGVGIIKLVPPDGGAFDLAANGLAAGLADPADS